MWRAWVRASWVLCTVLLVAGAARAECTKDTDCDGEKWCEAGACVDPAPAPVTTAPPVESAPPPPAPSPPPLPPDPAARAAMTTEPRHLAQDPPPQEAPVRYKRRSSGLMAVGIVATSIGTLSLLVAATSERRYDCDYSSRGSCNREPNYGAWALAGVLLGTGIPMIIVGSKKVPDTSTPTAALTPWLTLHGGGVGFRLAL